MTKLDKYIVNGYLPTIGIECHVQLKTKTKLFAGVSNDAREALPNSLISHICLGMPGALPVLNKRAVELAMQAAFALNTEPQKFSKFDRKHYFYPDLPKGYQITQFDEPIILGGHVTIEVDGKAKQIAVTRAHLEEDAGKSIHPTSSDYSLVDLNRAGTPLLEIVSEPQIHSAAEAKAYARELHLQMRYANVSEGDLYQGNMRFDVNVSVSKDAKTLGTRTETKNLNSFKSVEKAVDYEITRQIALLEKQAVINQETRGWDDAKQKTFSQRSKEEAHDYRYFPEPDVPPVTLTQKDIVEAKKVERINPSVLRDQLRSLGIDNSTAETLIDELPAGKFIKQIVENQPASVAKRIAHWLASDVQALVAEAKLSWASAILDEAQFTALSQLVESKLVSSTGAKTVLLTMVTKGGDPLTIAKEQDIMQMSDEGAIASLVAQVLSDNPQAAKDIQAGETKAIGFLVGQVMKQSKGKANPSLAQHLIKSQLKI